MDQHTIGVLGGGQLGRMLVEAAHNLNIQVAVLDSATAPAKQINLVAADKHITGSFAKSADVEKLAGNVDVITYEIEHVNTEILEELEKRQPYVTGTQWNRIQPSWRTVRTIQDKYAQKEYLIKYGIAVAKSIPVPDVSPKSLKDVASQLGYPLMLKSRTEAYDGRGNYPVKSDADIEPALKALANRPLYAEKWANFKMELAVMVVKTKQEIAVDDWEAATLAYPTVETIHEDSICKLVYAPARNVQTRILKEAQTLARSAVSKFAGTGVFGVELFLLEDDSLVLNEIAPRPHNSGHYTIEACQMSQYEAQVRAILPDLAATIYPGSTDLTVPAAIMLNILGGSQADSHLTVAKAALSIPGAKIHLYGKGDGRPGRKMGHITMVGASMSEVESKMHSLIHYADAIRNLRNDPSAKASDIDAAAYQTLEKAGPSTEKPRIAVVMGSDTDLATLRPGLEMLDQIGIPYLVTITSAHRTPQVMLDFGKAAASKGFKAIIAAAGGAAHLPGMMAAVTSVPVIGVPVKASSLDGLDSLLSIVQMPRGIPVATVSIGNSINAALLAARIIGTSEERVRLWVEAHLQKMNDENMAKAAKLEGEGWKAYKKLDA